MVAAEVSFAICARAAEHMSATHSVRSRDPKVKGMALEGIAVEERCVGREGGPDAVRQARTNQTHAQLKPHSLHQPQQGG